MDFLPLTSLTLILTWFRWPGVCSTIYTVRPGQRLVYTPLMSSSLSKTPGYNGRCIMTCKSTAGCSSVNVQVNDLTPLVTCELLGAYLHEAMSSLTLASGWTFIQEDPLYIDSSWALAFRASSAVGLSVWDTWHEDGRHDDPSEMTGCVISTSSLPCLTHYRGYVLDHWSNIDQVRITLYKDAAVVAQVTFDGQGSSRTSWLALSRIVTSTWTDLTSTSSANFFSVKGEYDHERRFFMSAFFNRCPGDSGWMVLLDVFPAIGSSGPCTWENTEPVRPTLLYSPLSTKAVWHTSSLLADFMMVHVTFIVEEDSTRK